FFPKFLSPIKLKNFAKEYQPRTTLTVGYNLQERPIYTRQIGYRIKACRDAINRVLTLFDSFNLFPHGI
ncbi:MAG: hypothetical protein IKY27_08965, partial [Bacteroidales bacterium]|nr:hypothetical protein [Bacteroidales bacterium]